MAARKCGKEIEQLITKYSLEYDAQRQKVRCKLTGHEMPARADTIQQYVGGKRYKLASTRATDDFVKKYAPHFSQDARSSDRIFCALTGRSIANELVQLEMHSRGRRFLREFLNWQKARASGETYVPTWKRERNRRNRVQQREEDDGSDSEAAADAKKDFFAEFGDSEYKDEEEGDEEKASEDVDVEDDEEEYDFAASSDEADEKKPAAKKGAKAKAKANGTKKRAAAKTNEDSDDEKPNGAPKKANGKSKNKRSRLSN